MLHVEQQHPDLTITIEILEAVADQLGVDVIELPPLGDAIDPDVLNKLFDSPDRHARRLPSIRFQYCGNTVVVDERRTVRIDPL